MNRLIYVKELDTLFTSIAVMLCAYFEGTLTFLFALLLGFLFNILAGLRADKVHFEMWRLCNFNGHKLKDSLIEVFFIILITYMLKSLTDLMELQDVSRYVVEVLIWVALYYYIRNGLRNLAKAYPKNKWILFVDNLISFHFSGFMPDSIKKSLAKTDMLDESEEETNKTKNENTPDNIE